MILWLLERRIRIFRARARTGYYHGTETTATLQLCLIILPPLDLSASVIVLSLFCHCFHSLLMCCCSQNNQHKILLIQAELKLLCTDSKSQEVMENPRIMAIPMTTLSDSDYQWTEAPMLLLCWDMLSAVIQTHIRASIVWDGEPMLTSWRYWRVFLGEHMDTMMERQTFADSVLCLIFTASQYTV